MPRARSRRVINRANSIIIARAGERYVSGERRTYAFNCSFSLSLSLSLTYTDSFLRCRNIGEETFAIASYMTHYPKPTLLSKNTPGCLPVDKITAILYTVMFSPAFFHLLSREGYNIQFVGYVYARRWLGSKLSDASAHIQGAIHI